MGLSCTKVQREQKNVQGRKNKGSLPRFWKKLRRTTPGQTDTATMAESSPLDEASSDPERDGGQRESSPLDEASSDPERDAGQRESSPLDETSSQRDGEQQRRKRKLSKSRYRTKKQKRHKWKLDKRRYGTG